MSAQESTREAGRDSASDPLSSAKASADGRASGQGQGDQGPLVAQVHLDARLDAPLLGHLSSLALLSPSPPTLQVCLLSRAPVLLLPAPLLPVPLLPVPLLRVLLLLLPASCCALAHQGAALAYTIAY